MQARESFTRTPKPKVILYKLVSQFKPESVQFPADFPTRLFYHAFMFLEVEGGLAICTEKYNDKLELIFGEKQLLSTFARSYRATGDQRKPSTQHSQCKVERYVSLQD